MRYYHLQNCLTIGVLLWVTASGAYRIRLMDKAARILFELLAITLVTESLAYYAAVRFHNNNPVYVIYSLIEIWLVSLYFNYAIEALNKRRIGIYIAIVGIVAGLINIIWFQSLAIINGNFLVVEGLVIIALCMYAIMQLLSDYTFIDVRYTPHFWFALILLFFWSITLLNWLLYDHLTIWLGNEKWIIDFGLYLVSIISNIGFALIYLFYPKMNKQYEPCQ